MKSEWRELKPKAIKLRKQGKSIKKIGKKLSIPISTLSGWFKHIELTANQKVKLRKDWEKGLEKGRSKAVLWHNTQKQYRLQIAQKQALETIANLDISSRTTLELALAMLYLGEGFKSQKTGLGNSDPLILKFFQILIIRLFDINPTKITYELHLRADQDVIEVKKCWSKQLAAPIEKFKQVSIDKRTVGKPTYPEYKGVCIIICGKIAIQRKLVYLSRIFCEKVIESMGG
jgi:hypothetical protein